MGKKAVPASPPLAPAASLIELADDAAHGLKRRMPSLSAHLVVTRGQAVAFTLVAVALAGYGILRPGSAWNLLVALTGFAFVAGTLFRAALAIIGGLPRPGDPPATGALPLYTVLVPLHREANVLPRLARALLLLDYPRDCLDIKLIVEEKDAPTVAVAREIARRGPFEVIVVPDNQPKTKPKACNYALNFARGEFTVIFDAEDRPERDQLRKAVAAFRARPGRIACLQARLNFYNAGENWLTNGIMAQTPRDYCEMANCELTCGS